MIASLPVAQLHPAPIFFLCALLRRAERMPGIVDKHEVFLPGQGANMIEPVCKLVGPSCKKMSTQMLATLVAKILDGPAISTLDMDCLRARPISTQLPDIWEGTEMTLQIFLTKYAAQYWRYLATPVLP